MIFKCLLFLLINWSVSLSNARIQVNDRIQRIIASSNLSCYLQGFKKSRQATSCIISRGNYFLSHIWFMQIVGINSIDVIFILLHVFPLNGTHLSSIEKLNFLPWQNKHHQENILTYFVLLKRKSSFYRVGKFLVSILCWSSCYMPEDIFKHSIGFYLMLPSIKILNNRWLWDSYAIGYIGFNHLKLYFISYKTNSQYFRFLFGKCITINTFNEI